uniref:Uncharacterized protein n=1 Tax=Anopheles farauti TaxID=69004 RepID=A0A182Q820_9DIPT
MRYVDHSGRATATCATTTSTTTTLDAGSFSTSDMFGPSSGMSKIECFFGSSESSVSELFALRLLFDLHFFFSRPSSADDSARLTGCEDFRSIRLPPPLPLQFNLLTANLKWRSPELLPLPALFVTVLLFPPPALPPTANRLTEAAWVLPDHFSNFSSNVLMRSSSESPRSLESLEVELTEGARGGGLAGTISFDASSNNVLLPLPTSAKLLLPPEGFVADALEAAASDLDDNGLPVLGDNDEGPVKSVVPAVVLPTAVNCLSVADDDEDDEEDEDEPAPLMFGVDAPVDVPVGVTGVATLMDHPEFHFQQRRCHHCYPLLPPTFRVRDHEDHDVHGDHDHDRSHCLRGGRGGDGGDDGVRRNCI